MAFNPDTVGIVYDGVAHFWGTRCAEGAEEKALVQAYGRRRATVFVVESGVKTAGEEQE